MTNQAGSATTRSVLGEQMCSDTLKAPLKVLLGPHWPWWGALATSWFHSQVQWFHTEEGTGLPALQSSSPKSTTPT